MEKPTIDLADLLEKMIQETPNGIRKLIKEFTYVQRSSLTFVVDNIPLNDEELKAVKTFVRHMRMQE